MIGRFFRRGERSYEDLRGEVQLGQGMSAVPYVQHPSDINPSVGNFDQDDSKPFPEDTFTVDQAVEMIGFGKFQIKLSFLTGLAWMADAMEMMILSILAPALHCEWSLPNWQKAMLTTVVFAGMMISSGIWGKFCDLYGRKMELILCSVLTFYFGFLSSFSPTLLWMLFLRGLVGVGIGGIPQSVTLYSEFLPSKVRSKCIVMIEIFWAAGACFVVALSIFVMPTLGWRYLLVFASLPLGVFTLCCLWLPESARYDMTRGRPEKALETLQRIAEENGTAMPLGKLVLESKQNVTKRGQVSDLFSKDLRVTTMLLWFIWLVNAFSYFGVVLMTTELFEADDSCHGGDEEVVKLGRSEPACVLECKMLGKKDYSDLLWTTVAEFPGLLVTILTIEWIGRRKTMAFEFLVFSFFVLLLNICTSRTILTFFLFLSRAFISGAFQAAYVYTPEVYPTTMRAVGLGSSSGMARIGALITPFVAQVMLSQSVNLAVSIYGVVSLAAAAAAWFLPIETMGREMQDTH